MSSCQAPQDAFYENVLKDVQQVSEDSIGGQVKDFYTSAQEDRDALNKHMVCKLRWSVEAHIEIGRRNVLHM